VRLANQATFGVTDALISEIKTKGEKQWLLDQFSAPRSIYGSQDKTAVHQWTTLVPDFCAQYGATPGGRTYCYRDWSSSEPLKWDFFRQATTGPDQLRQRVAFAFAQIFVISDVDLDGTYGFARFHQKLRDNAFGNFRDVLRAVTLDPMMAEYLTLVNNAKQDPNENYARELLQLFSVGTCVLNPDGSLPGGVCVPTYSNETVRAYAFALTGWTYPAGGIDLRCSSNCGWGNPRFYAGPMVPVAAQHDQTERVLLGGVRVPSSRTPQQALELVLDSIIQHPNTAPFIATRLIRALVTSNPSPAYVARVSAAFNSGRHVDIGSDVRGDLRATLAAILLDSEARSLDVAQQTRFGKLREPVLFMTAAVRALNGYTDGDYLGASGAGTALEQPIFNSPSVFNFFAPDYAIPASNGITGPEFGITHTNTVLGRINFAEDLFFGWWGNGNGLSPSPYFPGSIGTKLDVASFRSVAADPVALVDHMNILFTGGLLSAGAKNVILNSVTSLGNQKPAPTWLLDSRTRMAAYMFVVSPDFQIQR
jgi:hypothetical protein